MTRLATLRTMLAVVSVSLAACGGDKAPPRSDVATPPPEQAQAAPPVPAAGAPAAYVDIGVPECDQFAHKYLACIEKVPEGSRTMVQQQFEQTRELWSLTAEKPDRRAGLAAACAQQEKATKAGMARYDCDW